MSKSSASAPSKSKSGSKSKAADKKPEEGQTLLPAESYTPIVDQELIGFVRAAGHVYDDGDRPASTEDSDTGGSDSDNVETDSLVSFDEEQESRKLREEAELLSDSEVEKRRSGILDRKQKFEEKEVKRRPVRNVLEAKFGFTPDFLRHAAAIIALPPRKLKKRNLKQEPIRTHKRFDVPDLKITKNKHGPCKGEEWNWGQLAEAVRVELRKINRPVREKPTKVFESAYLEGLKKFDALESGEEASDSSDGNDGNPFASAAGKKIAAAKKGKAKNKKEDGKGSKNNMWGEDERVSLKKKTKTIAELAEEKIQAAVLKDAEDTKEEELRRKWEEKAELARILRENYTAEITPEEKAEATAEAKRIVEERYAAVNWEAVKEEENKQAAIRLSTVKEVKIDALTRRSMARDEKAKLFKFTG